MSKAPLTEAFGQWKSSRSCCWRCSGLVAGQAVVWYTGQFYALFFLQNILKVDLFTANVLIAWSLLLGTGGFIVFGSALRQDRPQADHPRRLPDRALTYFPLFKLLTATANPALLCGPGEGTSDYRRGSRGLLVPVQSDRDGEVHQFLRHRQGSASTELGQGEHSQRAKRHACGGEDQRKRVLVQRSQLCPRRGSGADGGRLSRRRQCDDREDSDRSQGRARQLRTHVRYLHRAEDGRSLRS